jgi:hypothetical protein
LNGTAAKAPIETADTAADSIRFIFGTPAFLFAFYTL